MVSRVTCNMQFLVSFIAVEIQGNRRQQTSLLVPFWRTQPL